MRDPDENLYAAALNKARSTVHKVRTVIVLARNCKYSYDKGRMSEERYEDELDKEERKLLKFIATGEIESEGGAAGGEE